MSKPTQSIFPIENGKLTTPLDANNLQILNLDASNLPGGSGNDTGTTTAILKGDGSHGFADAVAGTDYVTPDALATKEPLLPTPSGDLYLLTRHDVAHGSTWLYTNPASLGGGSSTGTTTAILKGSGAGGFADAVADTDYASVGSVTAKEPLLPTTTNDHYLLARRNVASGSAWEFRNPATVGINTGTTVAILKGDGAGAFADAVANTDYPTVASVTAKEPLLPTSSNDGFVLVRDADETWRFVDPVTLGSTNATYTDGATHSNTTFNSATAGFTANDTGKTIICAGNIPADTLITFVNATTVTLSNAATTTASGLTFVIVNRYLSNFTGTVTSVGVSAATPSVPTAIGSLFSVGVINSTTSPVVQFGINTAVGANTFYGNGAAFTGPAGFMSAGTARTALGGTTVGQAIYTTLATPATASFVRVKSDGTVENRTQAQVLGDIGAETALTFSLPLARSVLPATPNVISIPKATSAVDGYLAATDFTAFAAGVPGSRKITTTAPLTIAGVSGVATDLSTDRTIAMQSAAGDLVGPPVVALRDGYLTGADHSLFVNKPPNSRTIATSSPLTMGGVLAATGDLSANRTIGIQRASATTDGYLAATDFAAFNSGSAHTQTVAVAAGIVSVQTPIAPLPPITRVVFLTTLSGPMTVNLPPPNLYTAGNGYPNLEFVDLANPPAMTSFGITLVSPSLTTIDGVASITLARGLSYLRINSDGGARWNSSKYFVDSFKDPSDPLKKAVVDVSGLTPSVSRTLKIADAAISVSVAPTDNTTTGVVRDINADGTATKSPLKPTDMVPQEYSLTGTNGVISSGAVFNVTVGGSIDTVRIKDQLSGPITINWPKSSQYSSGEPVVLLDSSGSVSTTKIVTVQSIDSGTPDTFNAASSFVFDEANGRKVLTADNQNPGNWSVSLVKTTTQPFKVIIPDGTSTHTVIADVNAVKQNAQLNLLNGVNTLRITNTYDGMPIELVIVQPPSGAAGTLALPTGSYVAGNGLGVVSLTATNSAIDRLRGSFDGTLNALLWDAPVLNHTTAVVPTAPSALTLGTVTSSKVDMTWTDNSANEQGFTIERNTGGGAYSTIATVGAGVTSYTDNGVAANTTYHYRVSAYNAGGSSAVSNIITATTSAGGATADLWEVHFNENTGTSAASTVPVGGTVDLTYADWTTSTQSSAAAFNPTVGMGGVVNMTVTPNVTGTSGYTYRVLGFKNNGRHNAGASVVITTGMPTLNSGQFNTITWSAPTLGSADYYEIYRAVVPAGSGLSLGRLNTVTVPFTNTTFNDTGVATNGTIPLDYPTTTDIHTATAHSVVNYATNVLSVSFWIKTTFPNTTGTAYNIISAGSNNWQIRAMSANRWNITFPGGTSGTCTATVLNNVTSNGSAVNSGTTWHHVVVVINSTAAHTTTDVQLFYDGSGTSAAVSYVGTPNNVGANTFSASTPVIGSQAFAGAIDDVRIFTGALSSAQILALFNGNAQ